MSSWVQKEIGVSSCRLAQWDNGGTVYTCVIWRVSGRGVSEKLGLTKIAFADKS